MKIFALLFCTLLTFSLQAEEKAKRERIFHCMDFGRVIHVKELYIVETKKGSKTYFEVEVPYKGIDQVEKTFYRKLNLISKYEGRVLEFTTGNYRVKIDRALPMEKKYKAFVRLPRFDIHSTQWFCKDY